MEEGMTRKTREQIERLENRVTAEEAIGAAERLVYPRSIQAIEARLSALEDSLEAAELQIKQRKAENVYLNRLLDMLQHGIVAGGAAISSGPQAIVPLVRGPAGTPVPWAKWEREHPKEYAAQLRAERPGIPNPYADWVEAGNDPAEFLRQHGIVQKGGEVPNVSPAPESAEGAGNTWSK
jgi:hypothetical protein